MAMASILKTKKGEFINPVLKAYYDSKTAAKKKKVVLVAVHAQVTALHLHRAPRTKAFCGP